MAPTASQRIEEAVGRCARNEQVLAGIFIQALKIEPSPEVLETVREAFVGVRVSSFTQLMASFVGVLEDVKDGDVEPSAECAAGAVLGWLQAFKDTDFTQGA
jgi:hypothetical protein